MAVNVLRIRYSHNNSPNYTLFIRIYINELWAIEPTTHFTLVEMSGIEPESERIDLRMSTSIAGLLVSPGGSQPAEISPWLTAGTRKPLFRKVSGVALAALRLCVARHYLRQEFGVGGRVLLMRTSYPESRLCGERKSSIAWCAIGTCVLR